MSTPKSKRFISFIRSEVNSGIVLIVATVLAIFMANSAWSAAYFSTWSKTYVSIGFGEFSLSKPLYYWINDGLMAIFFLVIGLEIKMELLVGKLSSFRQASLPIIAAIGGMVVPALIYFSFNSQDDVFRNGWAIPMATDIAFALGILAMLGNRVPIGLKVFLTALAIVDDLGAVLSIAIFYTETIQLTYLLIAIGVFLLLMVINHMGVRKVWVFLFLGLVGIWYPLLMSGVHATIAGILIAFTIPAKRRIHAGVFGRRLETEIKRYRTYDDSKDKREMSHAQLESIQNMRDVCEAAGSPLLRIEHHLKPLALFVVMPIFAFANTGVVLNFSDMGNIVSHPIFLGISTGLLFGKTVGIFGFSWLAIKFKLVQLPEGVKKNQLFGASILAGIGFTMSLFISDLAFHGDELQIIAKKAIFFSSILAGVIGFLWIKLASK